MRHVDSECGRREDWYSSYTLRAEKKQIFFRSFPALATGGQNLKTLTLGHCPPPATHQASGIRSALNNLESLVRQPFAPQARPFIVSPRMAVLSELFTEIPFPV